MRSVSAAPITAKMIAADCVSESKCITCVGWGSRRRAYEVEYEVPVNSVPVIRSCFSSDAA
jgi:hypothetical protein